MRKNIEDDEVLRDLIYKVERLQSLRDALPRALQTCVGKDVGNLEGDIRKSRFDVQNRWQYLLNGGS